MKAELEHTRLDFSDQDLVLKVCRKFDCSEEELKYCLSQVGSSLTSIEAFWAMNADNIASRMDAFENKNTLT